MESELDHVTAPQLRTPKSLLSPTSLRNSHIQDQSSLKDQYIVELQQRLKRICEDFTYNFRLVEERDKELRNFEQQLVTLTATCKSKDAELADLRKTTQTKEDDFTAEVDFLRLRLEDAHKTIELLKSKETQSLQQEAEFSLQIDSIQATLNEKVQDLLKVNGQLEEERSQLLRQLATEKEQFEKAIEPEKAKLKELVDEHRQCATVLKETERKYKEEITTQQRAVSAKDAALEEVNRKLRQCETERNELLRDSARAKKESELAQVKAKMLGDAEATHFKEQLRALQEALSITKSQKATLEDVISSLEKQLDLERRNKERKSLRDSQTKFDCDVSHSFDKSSQWHSVAEPRSDEIASLRRSLLQAEEQARHYERELARTKRTFELEATKQQEDMKKAIAMELLVKTLERDKARLTAELRQSKTSTLDAESQQLQSEIETLRREKMASDRALRELRLELESRGQKSDYHAVSHSSFDLKRSSLNQLPREVSLDAIPSKDARYMVGLKHRLAVVKDELETKFHGRK